MNHLKLAVVGLSQTGKSSLVSRFLSREFDSEHYKPTNSCIFEDVVSSIVEGTILSVTIMDTPGREDDIQQLPIWYEWADAIIVVYSISLKHSFEIAKRYLQSLQSLLQSPKKIPIALVGAKEDLDRTFKRIVPIENGSSLASSFGAYFCETSAKTESGVRQLWNKIIGLAITNNSQIDEIIKKMNGPIAPSFKTVTGGSIFASPKRRLKRDGTMTRFLAFDNRKKEYYVALFNDYFVMAKPKASGSGSIVCLNAIPLASAIVLEGPNVTKKNLFFFRIHHVIKAKTYDFITHSLAEKMEWMDLLEESINAMKCDGLQFTTSTLIEEFQLKNNNRLWKRSDRVFGVNLADLVQKQSYKNYSELQLEPYFVSQAFEYLRTPACLQTRGIFQLPGCDDPLVFKLRSQWNTGQAPELVQYPPLVVTDLVKLFFEQLPLSVIPREFTDALLTLYNSPNESTKLTNICKLLSATPPSNFAVLIDVLVYLGCAEEHSEQNGLTNERAGLVFSRLLMAFESKQYRKCSEFISYLIKHTDKLIETQSSNDVGLTSSPRVNSDSSSCAAFIPVIKELFTINRERQLACIHKCKYKVLEIIKVMGAFPVRNMEYEASLQSMLITLNNITSYEPTFVKYLIDVSHFNTFYLRLLELTRLLGTIKPTKAAKILSRNRDALEAERIKVSLEQSLDAIFDNLDRVCGWKRDVRVAYFKIKKELERAQQLKQALGIPRDTELDSTMAALRPMYAEDEVREFWDKNFGLEKFIVKVDLFIDSLSRLNDRTLSDTERHIVTHILDHYQTGTVNIYRFALFVSGFGPITQCLANVIKMNSEKWFYGFVSYPESLRLLETSGPGTYIVRFSQSNPGNFSVDYIVAAIDEAGPVKGSPANAQIVATEIRTIKIHNTPGGFEVVRSEVSETNGAGSGPNSAANSAPNSAPSSGKLPVFVASPPPPQSTKLIAAQGSFRMRTVTLLQAPERRKSLGLNPVVSPIPQHLLPPRSGVSSAPGSAKQSSFLTPPSSAVLPTSTSPNSPALPSTLPPSLHFSSIEEILHHLRDLLSKPLEPNYFLFPHFHGCIGEDVASTRLQNQPEGTFLVRFGTLESTLSVHVVSSNQKVETFNLERVRDSPQVKLLGVTYKSLEDFISQCRVPCTIPLPMVQEKTEEPASIEDGTLEKIVEKLYDGSDIGATQVFLLTYRTYATPTAIIHILRERIQYHRDHNQDRTYRLRMGNFVKTWLTDYSWDIKSEPDFYKHCSKLINDLTLDPSTSAIGRQLQTLVQKNLEGNPNIGSSLPKALRADRSQSSLGIHSNVSSSSDLCLTDEGGFNEGLDDDEDNYSSTGTPPSSDIPIIGRRDSVSSISVSGSPGLKDSRASLSFSSSSLTLAGTLRGSGGTSSPKRSASEEHLIRSVLDIPVTEMAEQLTLIEAEVFSQIELHEFLQQGWLKADKEQRSPNVLKMVRLSTRISRWVVSEILNDDKAVKRAKLIEYFIQLGHELLQLRNFNALMAVLAALSGSALGRLKKTWDAVAKTKRKELEELSGIMDTDSNWSRYRTALLNAPPPKIPYLGLVLTDLVFIEDGNVDRLPSGHINWVKCERLAECLHQVQLCQQDHYQLVPNDTNVDPYVLEQAKAMSETEAYQRSLIVEPRSSKK